MGALGPDQVSLWALGRRSRRSRDSGNDFNPIIGNLDLGLLTLFGKPLAEFEFYLALEGLVVQPALLMSEHLDDMKAELGLDGPHNLTDLSFKRGLLEPFHHLAPRKPAQISAALVVGLVGGVLRGQFGERLALLQHVQDLLGGILILDEDVSGMNLLLGA